MACSNEELQRICRSYLTRLRYMARKHGLESWLNDVIQANKREQCEGTMKEVEMLSRLVNDERVERVDVPKILGKTYRRCNEDGDFDKVRKLPRLGLYSKIGALLLKEKLNKNK